MSVDLSNILAQTQAALLGGDVIASMLEAYFAGL